MKLSGVMPVHNEERLLPFSLPLLTYVDLDELVFLLDRCGDNSEQIINSWINRTNPKYDVRIYHKQKASWKNKRAEAFNKAFQLAKGDVVFGLGADCIYNPQVFDRTPFLAGFDVVFYGYRNWDLQKSSLWNCYIIVLEKLYKLIVRRYPRPFRHGIFGIKKKLWEKIGCFENIILEDFNKKHLSYEEAFILKLRQMGAKRLFRWEKNIHLRPDKNPIFAGVIRRKLHYPFYRVLLHAVLHFDSKIITGYLT